MGRKFAAPKRRDDAGWKKLAWMIENGWHGYNWPTSARMNLNQVRESLRNARERRITILRREKAEVSLAAVKRGARRKSCNSRAVRRNQKRNEQLELKAQRKYQDAVLARVKSEG